jgi:tRNA threonylcarbamoyladenosine biosynthesis protein TsaE
MPRDFYASSEEELLPAAACLEALRSPLILFYGELGAGKTALIRCLCGLMNVREEISSPTFSLVNEYSTAEGSVFHFDLYRIKDPAELLDIGFEEYLYNGTCLIEWPEIALDLIPPGRRTEVIIAHDNRGGRNISIRDQAH